MDLSTIFLTPTVHFCEALRTLLMKGGQDFKNKSFEELLVEDLHFTHGYERNVYCYCSSDCFFIVLKYKFVEMCAKSRAAEGSEYMTG